MCYDVFFYLNRVITCTRNHVLACVDWLSALYFPPNVYIFGVFKE